MTVLPTWRAETVSRPSVEWFQPQSETSSHLPKIDSWPAEGKTAWTDRLEGSLQPNAGISVRNDGGEGTCDPELPQSTLEPQKQAVPQFLHIDAAESAGKLCQPGLNALQSRQDGALTTERPVQATTAMAVPQAQDNQDPAAEPAQSKGEQINASTYAASEQQKLVASVPLQSFQVASVQEEREASPRTDGGIPDIAAVMRMEPVSAKTSPKKESEGSKDEGEPGAKEKEIVRLTWPGATTQRTFALPEQSRQELQSKSGEPENALHESILSQVREGVVSHDGKGNGRMTVRLNPSELGELQVHVRVDDQRVKVEIIAGSRTVREALMGNLDMLKETLLKQNLNMERFDVSSGRGNGFSQSFGAERERVRQPARTPVVLGAVQPDIPEEREGYDWGSAQSSMVDVRL
jgi:flagellar hook-length control protein FliK